MKYSEGLERQWIIVQDNLESLIRQLDDENGQIDLDTLNEALLEEKKRWENPKQFNCVWLNALSKEHPSISDKFQGALDSLHFEMFIKYSQPFSPKPSLIFFGVAIVIYVILYFTGVFDLILALIFFSITAISVWEHNAIEYQELDILKQSEQKYYVKAVSDMGEKLRKIVGDI